MKNTCIISVFESKNHSIPKGIENQTRKFILWDPSFMFCLGPPKVLRRLWGYIRFFNTCPFYNFIKCSTGKTCAQRSTRWGPRNTGSTTWVSWRGRARKNLFLKFRKNDFGQITPFRPLFQIKLSRPKLKCITTASLLQVRRYLHFSNRLFFLSGSMLLTSDQFWINFNKRLELLFSNYKITTTFSIFRPIQQVFSWVASDTVACRRSSKNGNIGGRVNGRQTQGSIYIRQWVFYCT